MVFADRVVSSCTVLIGEHGCVVCGDIKHPMHRFHWEWLKILKTHCSKAQQEELDQIGEKHCLVCSKHFRDGAPDHMDAQTGLKWLKTEFCGEAWLDGGQKSMKGKRMHPSAVESAPHAKRALEINSAVSIHGSSDGNNEEATAMALVFPQQSLAGPVDEVALLKSLYSQILKRNRQSEVTEIRRMFLDSEIGVEVVAQLAGEIVKHAEERFPSHVIHLCSRPLLKAALDSCESLKVHVDDKSLSAKAEVSPITVHRARDERLQVRFAFCPISPLAERFLTVLLQELNAEFDLDEESLPDEISKDDSDALDVVRKSRHSPHNRELIKGERQQDLALWTDSNAPIQSGSCNFSRLNFTTNLHAYNAYVDDMKRDSKQFFSFSHFCDILYYWSIKPTKYDKYACPLCYLLYHSGKSIMEIESDWHSIEKDAIWALYRSDIDNLKLNSQVFFLIIMDYCRVHELGHVSMETDEDRSKLSILNFTVILPGNVEHHFDYFATGKQGFAFMEAAVKDLATKIPTLTNINQIHFYSDGGLRTYGTIANMHLLSNLLSREIIYTYFPRYHGHSRCDAHFGRGKMALREKFPDGGLNSVIQVIATFGALPRTECYQITFSNLPKRGEWRPAWGIKNSQQIKFVSGLTFTNTLEDIYSEHPKTPWRIVPTPQFYPTPPKMSDVPANHPAATRITVSSAKK